MFVSPTLSTGLSPQLQLTPMHTHSNSQNVKFPDRGPHSAVAARGHEGTVLTNTPLYFQPTPRSNQQNAARLTQRRHSSPTAASAFSSAIPACPSSVNILPYTTFCPRRFDTKTTCLVGMTHDMTRDNVQVHRHSAVLQQAVNSMFMYVGASNEDGTFYQLMWLTQCGYGCVSYCNTASHLSYTVHSSNPC
jgi:hypothetical protein